MKHPNRNFFSTPRRRRTNDAKAPGSAYTPVGANHSWNHRRSVQQLIAACSLVLGGWRARLAAAAAFAVVCSVVGTLNSSVLAVQVPTQPGRRPSLIKHVGRANRVADTKPRAAALADCNGNGIPDDIDIENCVADPACDDCNINQVPDGCEIAAGTSLDLNLNGVPDECVTYDDGAPDNNWSSPTNWDDDEIPNNLDLVDDESVTVDANLVMLDLPVEVDTLRLLDGSFLSVVGTTNEDFEVQELGGILITSATAVQSRLVVGDGREVKSLIGTLHIASGGVYEAALPPPFSSSPAAATATALQSSGKLTAGNILIDSRCGEPIPGEMTLSGVMTADVLGNLSVDATQDCAVCALCQLTNAAVAVTPSSSFGGETPPILRIKDGALLRISGDLSLLGPVAFTHTSSSALEIGGDFVNQSTCPQCVQISGKIIFGSSLPIGAHAANAAVSQVFEVAGQDLGAVSAGFTGNFSMSTLEVAPGASLDFVDAFPNGSSGTGEALYVDTLILRVGSVVTVSNVHLYYNTLIDQGTTINTVGQGALVSVAGATAVPAVSTWGVIMMALALMTAGTFVVRRYTFSPVASAQKRAV